MDLPTFARMCCSVLDLQSPAAAAGGALGGVPGGAAAAQHCALLHSLHALFALYLEFKHNPAFHHLDAFEAAAAASGGGTAADDGGDAT